MRNENLSVFLSAMHVPLATAFNGSSVTWNGMLTFSESLLSRPLRQGTAAGKENTAFHDVRIQLGRGLLQYMKNCRLDFGYGLVYAVCYFLISDSSRYRVGGHEVRALYHERLRFFFKVRKDGSDGYLDFFGSDFSHLDVVLLLQIILDIARENVSGHPD